MEDLARLDEPDGVVTLRTAVESDLPQLVALLAADQLGGHSDEPGAGHDELEPYRKALAAITADPAHMFVVADDGRRVVGMMQLTVLPTLVGRGGWRAQLESVHVHEPARNRGVGGWMVRWAVEEARRRGCVFVQLTSNKRRTDAHRFYERLGFVASHEGMKLQLGE